MGLDTSYGAWHGPYSSFNKWRTWLAEFAGFPLREMYGFDGAKEWTKDMQKQDYYPLLNHSDCDGWLTVDDCKKTVSFLDKIIKKEVGEEEEYYQKKAVQFRDGCLLAIDKNEPIEFY